MIPLEKLASEDYGFLLKPNDLKNIYDDYIKYIEENNYLIKLLENNAPSIYVLFEDVLAVLDYIAEEYKKGSQLEEDLKDFFDAGYGYLTSVMTDLKMIFEDYFKSDVILLSKYGNLITYFFYIEDLKCHLDAEELLTKTKHLSHEKTFVSCCSRIANELRS